MGETLRPDLCVIGAGSAGFSVAGGARLLGARGGLIRGECLHTGCVPSKALLAAARVVHGARTAPWFTAPPPVDPARVFDHVQGAIAAIAPQDSRARYEGLGVRVIEAHARLVGAGAP